MRAFWREAIVKMLFQGLKKVAFAVCALLASSGANAQSMEEELLELVNLVRWENGQLPPLKGNALLDAVSEAHSQAMASRDFFAHCDLDTRLSPFERMRNGGYFYNSASENLAAGASGPAAVLSGWMNSTGHRAHILTTTHREIGVGYAFDFLDTNVRRDQDGDCNVDLVSNWTLQHYWTQDFGRRAGVYPLVIEREAYATAGCEVALYQYGVGSGNEARLSNDGVSWSEWEALQADRTWTLSGPAGSVATVYAQLRIAGVESEVSDQILLGASCGTAPGATPLFADSFD